MRRLRTFKMANRTREQVSGYERWLLTRHGFENLRVQVRRLPISRIRIEDDFRARDGAFSLPAVALCARSIQQRFSSAHRNQLGGVIAPSNREQLLRLSRPPS